jgi:hypothetical protein
MSSSREDVGSPPAREAEALLERLRICAFTALDAARAGDLERLRRAMEEREVLAARAEPLLARARADLARDPADAAARRSLLLTLRGVQTVDARLLAELEHRRAEVGEELLKLQEEARSPRYQPAPRTGQHLDLRR